MDRRARLNPFSAKRLAALAEQGVSRPWSTLTNSGAGLSRTAAAKDVKPKPRKRPAGTGPTAETVALLFERDHGRCARCGDPIQDERGRDWSCHHRQPRAMGGTTRADVNGPHNLLLLCGSATSPDGCHQHVENNRTEAYGLGWLVRRPLDPAEVPVLHAVHGWVWFTPDGSVSSLSPMTEEVTS